MTHDGSMNSSATETENALLAESLATANIPTLLLVLVSMTGDLSWLEPPFQPTPAKGLSDNDTGGLPEEIQQRIREGGLAEILEWRAGNPIAIPAPSEELMVKMINVAMGHLIPDE